MGKTQNTKGSATLGSSISPSQTSGIRVTVRESICSAWMPSATGSLIDCMDIDCENALYEHEVAHYIYWN